MQLPELMNFYLVGRTALTLYYGHRLSVDLDLFSQVDFSNESIIKNLEAKFPSFTYNNAQNPVGIFGFIDDIKVDFIRHHQFNLIDVPIVEDGIRLLGIRDIIAMKISAILKRGVKKDFWDIAELLQHFTIDNLIECYNAKYPNQQLLISIPQALTYFADTEESEDPISLKGQTWQLVKNVVRQKVNDYLK